MQATALASPDALVERLFGAILNAMDLYAVYLGDRLGHYRALAEGGPATSGELAARAGTAERYAREWLEQQAVTGILQVDDPAADKGERTYRLPDGYEAVLVDPDNLSIMTPGAQLFAGCVKPLPQVWRRFAPAAACRSPTTAPTWRKVKPPSPGRCSETCWPRNGCR